MTDLMGEISAASTEQSQGVAQVGEAVTQMDQVTQQNAALVEEMAAAATSLKSQAQELVQTVAIFELGDSHKKSQIASTEPISITNPISGKAQVKHKTKKSLHRKALTNKTHVIANEETQNKSKKAPISFAKPPLADEWESF
mgnify:FL=1